MARGRMISITLGTSQRFAKLGEHKQLGEFAQCLFPLIVSWCDDFGKFSGDAFTIKHRVWPTSKRSEDVFDMAIDLMVSAGLMYRYLSEDKQVIQIVQFSTHQQGLHKRTKSKFPDAPNGVLPPEAEPDEMDVRATQLVEAYPAQHQEALGQPYVQSNRQRGKDLEAARALCVAYNRAALSQIVQMYLAIDADHPKAKLIAAGQRTLPKLVTMAGSFATALKVTGRPTTEE